MTDGSLLSPPEVPGLTGLTVLARGGYATVYRAEQESVGRDVAVKVENRTLENERDRRRFLREARAAGRMSSHPHVVDLFDAGVTLAGHPYLIMELCEGSYADRIRNRPLGAAEARDVGVKIADALADAHELGVLHRDVKPANILYSRFGEPALADFGLAVLAEARDTSITMEVLTPAYAPPEMFAPGEPGPAVDVYSLSATLYALVAGHPPRWPDQQGPGLASLLDLFERQIPDVPGVPEGLLALLRRGMANDPVRRPTAAQLRDLLAALPLGAPPRVPLPAHPAPGRDATGEPGADPAAGHPNGRGRGEITEAIQTQRVPPASVAPGWYAPPAAAPDHHPYVHPAPSPGPGGQPPRVAATGELIAAHGARWPGPAVAGGAPPVPAAPVAAARGGSAWLPAHRAAGGYEAAGTWRAGRPGGRLPAAARPRARLRGGRTLLLSSALLALALLVAMLTWYGLHHGPASADTGKSAAVDAPGPGPSALVAGPSPSVVTAEGVTVPPGGVECGLPYGAWCPAEPQCYGALTTSGGYLRATARSCDRRHSWEVFALGTLPNGQVDMRHGSVASLTRVRAVCNEVVLFSRLAGGRLIGWRVDVLAPTPQGAAAGDRTFRCLAGRGDGQLTGSTLAR